MSERALTTPRPRRLRVLLVSVGVGVAAAVAIIAPIAHADNTFVSQCRTEVVGMVRR